MCEQFATSARLSSHIVIHVYKTWHREYKLWFVNPFWFSVSSTAKVYGVVGSVNVIPLFRRIMCKYKGNMVSNEFLTIWRASFSEAVLLCKSLNHFINKHWMIFSTFLIWIFDQIKVMHLLRFKTWWNAFLIFGLYKSRLITKTVFGMSQSYQILNLLFKVDIVI